MYQWISLLRFIFLYLPYIHNIHSLSRKNDDFHARVCGATEICVTDRTSRCNRTISMQRCVKHWSATHTHTHTHPLQHQSRRNCGAILHRRLRFRVHGSVSVASQKVARLRHLYPCSDASDTEAPHTHTNPLQHQSRRNCETTVPFPKEVFSSAAITERRCRCCRLPHPTPPPPPVSTVMDYKRQFLRLHWGTREFTKLKKFPTHFLHNMFHT